MKVIEEFSTSTLVNGAVDEIDLVQHTHATVAAIYIMNGIGLASTKLDGATPYVSKVPGEGITLYGTDANEPITIDIGDPVSNHLYIREYSNGGRGTNIPGLQNEFRYKLVLLG